HLRFAEGYYRKNGEPTGSVYGFKAVGRYLLDWYGNKLAEDFGPLALKTLQQRMIDDDRSRRYINDHTQRIKTIFKWGVSEELLPAEVYQALMAVCGVRRGRTAARETAPIGPIDDAIIDATLPHMPTVVADMVRLQRITGMRPAEVCTIRPRDLDRTGDVWTYRPESHKTQHHGRDRVVYMGAKAQAVLLRYLARDQQDYCFRPCDSDRRRRRRRGAGQRYKTASYGRAVRRAGDKAFPHPTLASIAVRSLTTEEVAELKRWQKAHRWSPNRLRHTAGTEIRRSFGLEAAQVILGHSTADVTQIYAERDAEKGRDVARQIG
ncbi:MAG: site-specific integrase, partial [Pirellulales bacterium]|nr:site-specific integrase [Pirellulales bacterium]